MYSRHSHDKMKSIILSLLRKFHKNYFTITIILCIVSPSPHKPISLAVPSTSVINWWFVPWDAVVVDRPISGKTWPVLGGIAGWGGFVFSSSFTNNHHHHNDPL